MSFPIDKYLTNDYFVHNPTWDVEDSVWKSAFVARILHSHGIFPASICDIGCGAGEVLTTLRPTYPGAELYGYDITTEVARFWQKHQQEKINFFLEDFFKHNKKTYDVILLLDVIEHVSDPFQFLYGLLDKARYFIFHIPLDMSAFTVLREKPLLHAREKTGHVHYFTKNLALLKECGFNIIEWKYGEAALSGPRRTLKTTLANIPRRILYTINKEFGVLALGGETLFVLASGSVK